MSQFDVRSCVLLELELVVSPESCDQTGRREIKKMNVPED